MDAGLAQALRGLQDQLQEAADAAAEGQIAASTVLFTQVGMSLGMYIGHFRVTLGPRFPKSPECEAINKTALLLNTTIVAVLNALEEEEQDGPAPSAPPVPYGYSPSADEDDE
jgi:hypothetical protein